MTALQVIDSRFADKITIDEDAYFLEVTGDSMLPVYRTGDLIMVSPKAKVGVGDRVVVKTTTGELMVRVVHSEAIRPVEFAHLDPAKSIEKRPLSEIESITRITWATQ